MSNDRQTGRTSRTMLAGILYARASGQTCIYVVHNRTALAYMRSLWIHLGGNTDEVRFITPDYERVNGYLPEQIFVDHYANEVGRFGPHLKYLLRQQRDAS